MYEILIRQCVREGRPDVAAKIFVGLVEEWVTEGRIAEGADVEDFCEGIGSDGGLVERC
jgi:pentatricopeptide repeat protein